MSKCCSSNKFTYLTLLKAANSLFESMSGARFWCEMSLLIFLRKMMTDFAEQIAGINETTSASRS